MSKEGYLVGGDIGSGSCKVTILRTDGLVMAEESVTYPASYPHPGWVEQDAELWYEAFCTACRNSLAKSEIDPKDVLALAIVGVTHNAVILDKRGLPLAPSILIFDTRSNDQVQEIKNRWGEETVREKTLNDITPQWTWPQLLWFRDENPDLLATAVNLLFMKDYVRNKLAPSLVTDTIDAQGSLLFDPKEKSWINEFIENSGIPSGIFPPLVEPTEKVSAISRQGEADSGLPQGTPVIAGCSDTAAEAMGCGANIAGRGYVKLASVGRIAVTGNRPLMSARVLNYSHVLDGLWYPGTGTKAAATAFQWWRDCLDSSRGLSYKTMDAEAAEVPPGSDGVTFLPHILGQWSPYWNDDMRGAFLGLHARHGRPHLTRAVLEGVAFSLKGALDELQAIGAKFDEFLLVGGGASSRLWSQIIADVIEKPISIPNHADAAFGACLLAGMGIGVIDSAVSDVQQWITYRAELEPRKDTAAIYRERFDLYRDLNTKIFS